MKIPYYSNGRLYAEQVPLAEIAEEHGTPCYVYSRATIEDRWRAYDRAFGDRPHLVCYAVKANSNLAILNLLARLGSGFDVVSAGELQRVIQAGGDPSRTVFSGVGKRPDEMKAALQAGIRCFNVESGSELYRLDSVAGECNTRAPVSLRINPDIDANTHPYISTGLKENKFGIDIDRAESLYQEALQLKHLRITGIDCHIGSQITAIGPFQDACGRIMELFARLRANGVELRHINLGGGLGICYRDEAPPDPPSLVNAIVRQVPDEAVELLVEPGRSITGNAGLLITRVLYIKETTGKNFAVVDAAMNDLIRPVLYDAWQDILPVRKGGSTSPAVYDIVGPVCESADFLGLHRHLSIAEGDLLAISDAGAYGFCMSSNYNTRPRPAEILVDGGSVHVVRPRERIEDLFDTEKTLP